ncbi:hypothetical protein [Streptomyces sp. NPDC048295]|uniref:hypothetical protein n=1 Tax=Streptomyces sp. NPDC048295 TaxID=3154617 RepID=UPI0034306223
MGRDAAVDPVADDVPPVGVVGGGGDVLPGEPLGEVASVALAVRLVTVAWWQKPEELPGQA